MLRTITSKLLLVLSLSVFSINFTFAQEGHETHTESKEATHEEEKFDIGQMIMHHISDSHEWEFAHGLTLPLPVILYTQENGLEIFSSKRFTEGKGVYNGYINNHEHIHRLNPEGGLDEEVKVWDLSITKNVASLMLSAIILMVLMSTVAKSFDKNRGKAPKGIQSFMEPIIFFIRDEVVVPNIGKKKSGKYLPYLLTLFFFILINNLLGLIPGGANLTGNITITLFLAVITFIITHVNANKHYWLHIVKPEGVPTLMLPLMWVVEIAGVFMKPMSLTIRLFANITAGHIIILSLLGLIFIFQSFAVGGVVTIFTLFMNAIELLVAFLQAFIFTLLTAMYIGSATEDHHPEHDEVDLANSL